MKVSYENDRERGAGNGIVRCAEELFAEGDVTFELQRASDRLFLSEQGWVPQGSLLRPAEQCMEESALLLLIGAGVVNQLDTQEGYRLTLHTADGQKYAATLRVQEVLFGPETPRNNAVEMPQAAAPAAPQPPAPPQPEAAPAPVAPAVPEHLDDTPLTPAPPKKSALPLVLGVVLLLALAGAGAWWFLRTPPPPPVPQAEASDEQKPAAGTPEAASEKKEPEKAAPEKTAPPQPEEAPAPTAQTPATAGQAAQPSAEQRVTLFFGGQERSPQAAAQLSRELPKATPVEQDAVYRLYYFAGEHGENSVLMDYAACLDPAQPRWGSINKDAPAAWAIYEKAKAAGEAKAAAAQAGLKAWLEKQAASGDTQAALWIKELR